MLIYEILDEIIDFGHPQLTSSELIKPLIVNEPVPIIQDSGLNLNIRPVLGKIITPSSVSSSAKQRSIADNSKNKNKKNEIFVDVFEKISVLFNASGYVINSSIEGCIMMKYSIFFFF